MRNSDDQRGTLTPRRAVFTHDTILFPSEQAEKIRATDLSVFEKNTIISYEATLSVHEGDRVYLVTKGPLRNEDGSVIVEQRVDAQLP